MLLKQGSIFGLHRDSRFANLLPDKSIKRLWVGFIVGLEEFNRERRLDLYMNGGALYDYASTCRSKNKGQKTALSTWEAPRILPSRGCHRGSLSA